MQTTHKPSRWFDRFLAGTVAALLLIYIGIFFYLNMFQYTNHVDSDIAVDAMLAREIWVEKDLTPDNWIASTERLVLGVPALSSLFYAASGSMVFSMGLACVITGALLLAAVAFALRRCDNSRLAVLTALLALCALPINGLRNDGQMVPFVMLLWFLFAGYYALHSICLFLCIAFYLYLRITPSLQEKKSKFFCAFAWIFLTGLCGGLALGGMRCLQVVVLPLTLWEIVLLFFDSEKFNKFPPRQRWLASGFIASLLAVGILAKMYPTNVPYPMYIQNASGMAERLFSSVPAAVLECLGIAGGCTLNSFSALMQLGILALLIFVILHLIFLFGRDKSGQERLSFCAKSLLQALGSSFLLTVFIEVVTNAEPAHNYFFVIWFVFIAVIALSVTYYQQHAPGFARLIVSCICIFAVCNLFYTYKDCLHADDNLSEYREVIEYMESQDLDCGYAEFWDASRICIMTDGALTMGHCYRMSDLKMYWWTTSTKWYVPNLPEEMDTAYIVPTAEKEAFLAQFEDASAVTLGFENERFAVYRSRYNFVRML